MNSTAWLLKQRYNIITYELIIGSELLSDNRNIH